MENDEQIVVEEEGVVEDESQEQPEEETTDWKAEALKLRGINKRLETKIKKGEKPVEQPQPQDKPKSNELGYAEKAFLRVNDIKGAEELKLVQNIMADTGKSLDEVIESKYFQAELKELREEKATKEAIPTTSKRSNTATRDTVDYWIAKGELPPVDQVQLRRDVLNARIKKEAEDSKFSNNPVVLGF